MLADKYMDIEKAGDEAPAWITTFADLMSLLLCFFVLMLSFSETDRQMFKVLSGSLRRPLVCSASNESGTCRKA